MYENPGSKARQDVQNEIIDIASYAHRVTGIDKQDIILLKFVERRQLDHFRAFNPLMGQTRQRPQRRLGNGPREKGFRITMGQRHSVWSATSRSPPADTKAREGSRRSSNVQL
jgi:hypothetical protein